MVKLAGFNYRTIIKNSRKAVSDSFAMLPEVMKSGIIKIQTYIPPFQIIAVIFQKAR